MLTFRYSTPEDWDVIHNLLKQCFGHTYRDWSVELDKRYFMAFDTDSLVALTGINETDIYKGLEVDWSCVLPHYRGHNTMTLMLNKLLTTVKADVYCSCWRVLDNPINLHKSMSQCGFELIQKCRSSYAKGWYCGCNDCVYSHIPNCRCYEDLYVRYYNKHEV